MIDSHPARDPQVVRLIANEEFVVVYPEGAGDELDALAIRELRVHAYKRRGKDTLGLPVGVETLETLAEFAASGMVGNAAWALFPA